MRTKQRDLLWARMRKLCEVGMDVPEAEELVKIFERQVAGYATWVINYR